MFWCGLGLIVRKFCMRMWPKGGGGGAGWCLSVRREERLCRAGLSHFSDFSDFNDVNGL